MCVCVSMSLRKMSEFLDGRDSATVCLSTTHIKTQTCRKSKRNKSESLGAKKRKIERKRKCKILVAVE